VNSNKILAVENWYKTRGFYMLITIIIILKKKNKVVVINKSRRLYNYNSAGDLGAASPDFFPDISCNLNREENKYQ
jgi:hypothetical protein